MKAWTDGEGVRWVRLRPHGKRYPLDVDAFGLTLIITGGLLMLAALAVSLVVSDPQVALLLAVI